MKPRRTASGVATITVITKPAVLGDCLFSAPKYLRMPKAICTPSRRPCGLNCFDPYLQVSALV